MCCKHSKRVWKSAEEAGLFFWEWKGRVNTVSSFSSSYIRQNNRRILRFLAKAPYLPASPPCNFPPPKLKIANFPYVFLRNVSHKSKEKSQLILGKLQGWERKKGGDGREFYFFFSSTTKENACGKWKKRGGRVSRRK